MRKLIYILALAFVVMSCEKNKEEEIYETYNLPDIYGEWVVSEIFLAYDEKGEIIDINNLDDYYIRDEYDGKKITLSSFIPGENLKFFGDSKFAFYNSNNSSVNEGDFCFMYYRKVRDPSF